MSTEALFRVSNLTSNLIFPSSRDDAPLKPLLKSFHGFVKFFTHVKHQGWDIQL